MRRLKFNRMLDQLSKNEVIGGIVRPVAIDQVYDVLSQFDFNKQMITELITRSILSTSDPSNKNRAPTASQMSRPPLAMPESRPNTTVQIKSKDRHDETVKTRQIRMASNNLNQQVSSKPPEKNLLNIFNKVNTGHLSQSAHNPDLLDGTLNLDGEDSILMELNRLQ